VKRFLLPSLFLSVLCLSSVPAHAQEAGKVGLVMSMPTDVGVIWHVNDNIAIRPEINFHFGSSESEADGTTLSDDSHSGFGLEVSGLFYMAGTDSVRTYVTPRIGFDWESADDDDGPGDVSANGMEVSLSYGVQYSPVSRFSIFGELGLEYGRGTSTIEVLGTEVESKSSVWGPRTEVGVILYLGRN
jgi:hypothetical protein